MTNSSVDVVARNQSVIIAVTREGGCKRCFVFSAHGFVFCRAAENKCLGISLLDVENIFFSKKLRKAGGSIRFRSWVYRSPILSVASSQIVDGRYGLNRKFNLFAHVRRGRGAVVHKRYVRDRSLSCLEIGKTYFVYTKICSQLRICILLLKLDRLLRASKGESTDGQTNNQSRCAEACDPDLSPRRLEKLFCRVGHRLLGGQVLNFALDGSRSLSLFSQGYAERHWINGGAFRLPAARSDGAAQNSYKNAGQGNYKATVLHAAALAQISRFVQ